MARTTINYEEHYLSLSLTPIHTIIKNARGKHECTKPFDHKS